MHKFSLLFKNSLVCQTLEWNYIHQNMIQPGDLCHSYYPRGIPKWKEEITTDDMGFMDVPQLSVTQSRGLGRVTLLNNACSIERGILSELFWVSLASVSMISIYSVDPKCSDRESKTWLSFLLLHCHIKEWWGWIHQHWGFMSLSD